MKNKLYVSSSPHIKSNDSTQKIMLHVIVSLMPALIAACIIFGIRSLWVTLVTVTSCVLSEYLSRKIMKRNNTVSDLSAVVTGILLAFNLPVTINLAMAAFGGVIAIVVVKQMFGGLGQNFVNPALAARIILQASFPSAMSTWTIPFSALTNKSDIITTATPLSKTAVLNSDLNYLDMFLGLKGGCLGEVCALALILGGIYLLIKKVIKLTIPASYILTVVIFSIILGKDPLFQILSGGLLLGAIFMATDYVTSPLTNKGRIIFGIGCGIITMLIRVYGSLPEGVSFSILLMNILTPHIENFTKPVPFGERSNSK